MRFACSNLAWEPSKTEWALEKLIHAGFSGVEIAPTHQWGAWENATTSAAKLLHSELKARQLSVPALQAILFQRPDLRLFDKACWPELVMHFGRVASLAEVLEANVLVLGAPRQRDVGGLAPAEALEVGADILRVLAGVCSEHGVVLCIEPNAREYGCNFIYRSNQGRDLIELVGHRGFGLHLDAAAMYLEGENVSETLLGLKDGDLKHFHISEPGLRGFAEPVVPHKQNLRALDQSGYRGWASIETTAQAEFAISLSRVESWAVGMACAAQ